MFLIGLSVSFLLFVPLLMNFAYPPIGIARPLSLAPLVTTFSVILAGLSLAAYKKGLLDLQIYTTGFKELIGKIAAPPVLGAALIVIIGILGGLSMMFYLDSIFSLLLGLSIVLVVVLIIADKISPRFYPLYVVAIAVSLQFGRTLTSPYLIAGSDSVFEVYIATLVKAAGVWNPNFLLSLRGIDDYYAMLSVVLLPNVYSIVLNLGTSWVLKLIYPIIFAFVPLGLYEIFKTQVKFSSKSAFLAVFLFMSFFAFAQAMPIVPRQEIAELFLVLAVLLIMNKYSQASKKAALLIVFIGSLAVSHYATSYIFLFYLGVFFIGSAFITSRTRQKRAESTISVTIAVLAVTIIFGWYLFAGAGATYAWFINIGAHTFNVLSAQLFSLSNDPAVTSGLGGSSVGLSLIQALAHYWQLSIEVFIMAGLAYVILRRKTPKMSPQFLMFSLSSFLLMIVVIVMPALGGAINTWRSFSFALLFLAPLCIFGVQFVVETVFGSLRANRGLIIKLTTIAFIVLLVPYFLFNYSFVAEIAEHPANYAFLPTQNPNGRGVVYNDYHSWSYMGGPTPIETVFASTWLSGSVGKSSVFADWIRSADLVDTGNVSPHSIIDLSYIARHPSSNAYIYLGPANVQQQSVAQTFHGLNEELSLSSVPELAAASRVYDNGLCEVYRTQ